MTVPGSAPSVDRLTGRLLERRRIVLRVPGRTQDHGPGIVRTGEDRQAVATPAGSSRGGVAGSDPRFAQPDTELEFPERVLDRLAPALAHVGGEGRGQLDVDRFLGSPVLVGVEDLLRRTGHVVVQGVHRLPAAARLDRQDECLAGGVREEQALDEDRRGPGEDLHRRGVRSGGLHLGELLGGQVLAGPQDHQQRRVPLVHGRAREGLVGLVEQLLLSLEHVEARVLQGMVVLVGERDLVGAVDGAASRDHVEGLGIGPIEARDLTVDQVKEQLPERLLGRHQPERLVQPLVGGDVHGRVVLVEALGIEDLEIGLADGLALDIRRRQPAQGDDLVLDGIERGFGSPTRGRAGRARRAGRWRARRTRRWRR